MTRPAIAVLGDINVDLTLQVDAYPPEGGEGIATREMHGIGGSATNTALILARLGQPVTFIGRTGGDAWGRWCTAEMTAAGIDTRWVGTDETESTQVNIVVVGGTGERTMFAYRGANQRLEAAAVAPEAILGAGLLHVSGYALLAMPQRDAALAAIGFARTFGIPVSLDVPSGVIGRIDGEVRALLSSLDTLFLGPGDVRRLADASAGEDIAEAAGKLLAAGTRQVVMKDGAHGSAYYRRGLTLRCPAPKVEAVDTTGAGDAFAAGFLFAAVRGLSPAACSALANAAGAVAVTHAGTGALRIDAAALLGLIPGMADDSTRGQLEAVFSR